MEPAWSARYVCFSADAGSRATRARAHLRCRRVLGFGRLDTEYNPSYTEPMKTAISIPDDVFERADETAAKLGMSRSEFYTQAVRAYLATRLEANITASYDAAFADGDEDDELRRQATRKALLAVEWTKE
jgi:predicted transcriptional regulator